MRAGSPQPRGFALIIVLTVIFVMAVIAGGFAYSMKVETRLAANANSDSELEWMGRSGVELAKYVLDQSARGAGRVTSLKQLWAGGPGDEQETNSPLMGINLRRYDLPPGYISVRISDLERRLNINSRMQSGPEMLQRALALMGVDAGEIPVIVDSIQDWRDPDDLTNLSGTESDFYLNNRQPGYFAKNGPIDDLSELLMVNGVSPEIYWGPRAPASQTRWADRSGSRRRRDLVPVYPFGLVDFFTALSSGAVNINTASPQVLQVALGVTDDVALNIVRARAGLDGQEGTEDDLPFPNTGALAAIPGLEGQPQMLRAPLTVVSTHFEVVVDAYLGNAHRQCVAVVARGISGGPPGEGGVKVLEFSWR